MQRKTPIFGFALKRTPKWSVQSAQRLNVGEALSKGNTDCEVARTNSFVTLENCHEMDNTCKTFQVKLMFVEVTTLKRPSGRSQGSWVMYQTENHSDDVKGPFCAVPRMLF